MRCILCEKPSVARDVARVLGADRQGDGYLSNDEFVVTWAFGHLAETVAPEEIDPSWKRWSMETLPMLPPQIPLHVVESGKKQFGVIKKLFMDKRITSLICATDAGREGELIFRRIYILTGCQKPFDRLWISSMTDQAIKEGFAALAPSQKYDLLYQSAKCRSEADWLVGMNGSRAFTLRYDVLLSVGRVQTPTLAMLVKRLLEIQAFVPQLYYETRADFGAYSGIYNKNNVTRLKTKEEAQRILDLVKGKQATVSEAKKEQKRQPPPFLYDLTTLQREANARYGMTAAQTLATAQSLYERYKLLTYPRTDSRFLPNDQKRNVFSLLMNLPPQLKALLPDPLRKPGSRVFDDAKISDHHAIIPTGKVPPPSLPQAEQRIFDMVQRRLIAVFMPDYVYEAVTVHTKAEGLDFVSKGKTVLDEGWQRAMPPLHAAKDDDEATLPPLSVGDQSIVQGGEVLEKKTKAPAHYTENTLLDAMEHAGRFVDDERLRDELKERGIGTPATRAAILERLIQVGYVRREKRLLIATDKGVRLIQAVPAQLSSPETTGRWEKGLRDIEKGTLAPERFMDSIRRYSAFLVQAAVSAPPIAFPVETRRAAAKPPVPKARKTTTRAKKRTP